MNILFDEKNKIFLIHTQNSSYAMEINKADNLVHLYWGNRIIRNEDLPINEMLKNYPHEEEDKKLTYNLEYAGWGGYFFDEPALKVKFADNVRDLVLKYDSYQILQDIKSQMLTVTLTDRAYSFKVHLQYRIYEGSDIIDRSCILENAGTAKVMLENIKSAVWFVPRGKDYRLSFLSGRWSGEYQLEQIKMTQSKTVLEARKGISGPDITPWFALNSNGNADETKGRIWFGVLHWAGNWKIVVEMDRMNQIRVTGGINEFDSSWCLKPGEKFTAPTFSGGYTELGFGEASRMLHDYQRNWIIPAEKAQEARKIVYNSWEAFYFNINEEQQLKLAEKAAYVGAEVFVLDDGWFSTRDWCNSGLGDWYPSKTKFPNGLNPLINRVNALGMDFGLWVEPEMVNPDSDLYRNHPDWILRFPGREGTQMRNQFVLNLAREDVKAFIYSFLSRLLTDYNIKYIKWDMNRYITEPGWPEANSEEQSSVWIRYIFNLYDLYAQLQQNFPWVTFENCCSGGGRVNLGMAKVSDILSRSDNSDPLDSLKLQYGYSFVYLPKIAGASSIGISPNGINQRVAPLRYRAHVAMLTTPYINLNLLTLNEVELLEMKEYMDFYKKIRPIIQEGDFYRLVSPYGNQFMAVQYVSKCKNEAVLFVLGQSIQFMPPLSRILLQGLDPDTIYEVEGYKDMSGRGLMNIGIEVSLFGDFDSKVIVINKKD